MLIEFMMNDIKEVERREDHNIGDTITIANIAQLRR